MTRSTIKRSAVPAAIALVSAVVLAGCNASVNFTISAESLADEVSQVLQEQVNSDLPPTVDCGSEVISLVVDETVECELSVDGFDEVYDTTVTITEVDGTTYAFDVLVAEEPR